jgi:hypothetical protein
VDIYESTFFNRKFFWQSFCRNRKGTKTTFSQQQPVTLIRTYIPPAFYGRDGSLVQPPSFEMAIESFVDKVNYADQLRDK